MAKVKDSWSKPDGVHGLIGRKQVDQSIFTDGTVIPREFYADFVEGNSGYYLSRGEKRDVILLLGDTEFPARLESRTDGPEQWRIMYRSNGGIIPVLQERLWASAAYLDEYRTLTATPDRQRLTVITDAAHAEYLAFYSTGTPFRYRVEIITAADRMWTELQTAIGEGLEVKTLSQGASNQLTVTGDAIQVVARRADQLPKDWFVAAWKTLLAQKYLTEATMEPPGKYRSTAVLTILAMLPYVEYITAPRVTLFLKGYHYPEERLRDLLETVETGPVLWSGKPNNPRTAFFLTDTVREPADALVYHGRFGKKLSPDAVAVLKGNGERPYPLYGFRAEYGRFVYFGRYQVGGFFLEELPAFRMVAAEPLMGVESLADDSQLEGPTFRCYRIGLPPGEPIPTDRIAIGWDEVGDLSAYHTLEELVAAFRRVYGARYRQREDLIRRHAGELWTFRQIRPNAAIVISRGEHEVTVGAVAEAAYEWDPSRVENRHTVRVNTTDTRVRRMPRMRHWATSMVEELSEGEFDRLWEDAAPNLSFGEVAARFAGALRESHIQFGQRHDEVVRSFLASLVTKRLAILTGLSGSGKTQIALKLGEWFGEERHLIVPVRPDWTGPEALLGYEDALQKGADGRPCWQVPAALAFMLKAASDPYNPYLLVLDEMNLAHVERYFADVLSGMESGEPVLPNLNDPDGTGRWQLQMGADPAIRFPDNLFVVGTVNVDETTYMFSPKVLDRANTFEFRVDTEDLEADLRSPAPCAEGPLAMTRGFLALATDSEWHVEHGTGVTTEFGDYLRRVHALLSEGGFEFGHRVFREATRFAVIYMSAGGGVYEALDLQILQKVLPRLHGTRKRLEPTLCALGQFCYELNYQAGSVLDGSATTRFNPLDRALGGGELRRSFDKVKRMTRGLRANQFTSFTEQ